MYAVTLQRSSCVGCHSTLVCTDLAGQGAVMTRDNVSPAANHIYQHEAAGAARKMAPHRRPRPWHRLPKLGTPLLNMTATVQRCMEAVAVSYTVKQVLGREKYM